MKIKKKITKNFFVQHFLALITVLYIKLVRVTSVIIDKNIESPNSYWDNNKPFILAFWHSQLLMIKFSWNKNKKLNILASGHSDGQFGGIVAKHLGVNIITISKEKKKINIRPIFQLLKKNNYIGITPDGPRGPKEKVSDGIIKIAKTSKIPIIPVGYWSSKNFSLNSWDSFLITYPFSKSIFTWSDPILIPHNIEGDEIIKFQSILETKINDCIRSSKKELSV